VLKKYLFLDRDGTLIAEPDDHQVDHIDKLMFLPGVFSALTKLKQVGYKLVIVTNQDGLGASSFPTPNFLTPHQLMLKIFTSQGIIFDDIRICPHRQQDNCECRKPKLGLLLDYLREQKIDRQNSFVIGDRATDLQLAQNIGVNGIQIGSESAKSWNDVAAMIMQKPRQAKICRRTNETEITVEVNLDKRDNTKINTNIGFFDHMLEQLIKHAGISANIKVTGDLHIDEHHTIEDTALALGAAIKQALNDKYGITRYGFLLPMDEALVKIAIDLSGRAYCSISLPPLPDKIGTLATEMIPHFFRSLAMAMQMTLHIEAQGENSHHIVEALFKGVGRALAQAIKKESAELPSTKGVL